MTAQELKARMWEILATKDQLSNEYQNLLNKLAELQNKEASDAASRG